MNPVDALPPGLPLTLHETLAFVVPARLALRVCDVPKSTDAEVGVTVTLTAAGVGARGVGVVEPASPPPQPAAQAAKPRRTKTKAAGRCGCAAGLDWVQATCERGRMHRRNAGEGPADRTDLYAPRVRGRKSKEDGKLLELRVLAQLIVQNGSPRAARGGRRRKGRVSRFGTDASRVCFIRELRSVGLFYLS